MLHPVNPGAASRWTESNRLTPPYEGGAAPRLPHRRGAPGGTRTLTVRCRRSLPCPLGHGRACVRWGSNPHGAFAPPAPEAGASAISPLTRKLGRVRTCVSPRYQRGAFTHLATSLHVSALRSRITRAVQSSARPLWWQVRAPGRDRTCDLPVRNRALYPLSYRGLSVFRAVSCSCCHRRRFVRAQTGFEPAPCGVEVRCPVRRAAGACVEEGGVGPPQQDLMRVRQTPSAPRYPTSELSTAAGRRGGCLPQVSNLHLRCFRPARYQLR
jgi:hypothetical protein